MRGDPYVARLSADFGRRGPTVAIRGSDIAGTVESVGSEVTGLRVGDEVYGMCDGALAELVCAHRAAGDPQAGEPHVRAGRRDPARGDDRPAGPAGSARRRGSSVLVNGASGGVGTFAVQLARAAGAEVTAVCSTRNVELVRSLGADHVVDYTRDDAFRAGRRYDVVLDLVGNRSLRDLRRALAPDGTLVLSGGGSFEGGSLFGPIGLLVRSRLVAPFVRQQIVAL